MENQNSSTTNQEGPTDDISQAETTELKPKYSNAQPLFNLAVLLVIGGIYHIYWYGQNWQYLAQYKKYRVPNGVKLLVVIFAPALSILLAVFKLPLWLIIAAFPISLIGVVLIFLQLNDIKNLAEQKGCAVNHYPKSTLAYMVFMLTYSNVYLVMITASDNFKNYIAGSSAVNIGLTLLSIIIGLGFYAFLILAQKTLNGIWKNEQPSLTARRRLSIGEIIFLVIAFLAGWGISGQLLSLAKTDYQVPQATETVPGEAVESVNKDQEPTLQENNQNVDVAKSSPETNATAPTTSPEIPKIATENFSNNNQNNDSPIKQLEACTPNGQLAGGISYEKTQVAYYNETFNAYIIRRNGAELATITSDKCHPYVFWQNDKYIFLASDRTRTDRVLYPGSPDIYRVNLAENKSEHITLEMADYSVALDDISPDGSQVLFSAWGVPFGGKPGLPSKMVVKYLNNNDKKEFIVPGNYRQPGSGKFSPDAKKFAYAAGDIGSVDLNRYPKGIPEGQFSDKFAIFVTDIESGQQTELDSREEYQDINNMGKYIVEGWFGDSPNYHYKNN
jgi:hypothetical protein